MLSRPELTWLVFDCRKMNTLEKNSYDLIIDKALFDSVLCGNHAFLNVAKMTREIYRLLKPGGVYCLIS